MSKGYNTGMAGEFAVMEKLFRLGHQASLSLGNAKTVDIFSTSPSGTSYQVSVKSIRRGGKWGIGATDYTAEKNLVFVLLHYSSFEDLHSHPTAWVLPASAVMRLRRPWLRAAFAIFCSSKDDRDKLERYKDAWHLLK